MSYTTLWIIWGIFFGVIEGAAIIDKRDGTQTLTEHIVQWASLKNKSKGWIARRGSLIAFLLWLVYHFAVRSSL